MDNLRSSDRYGTGPKENGIPVKTQAVEKVGVGPTDALRLGSKRPSVGVFDVKPRLRGRANWRATYRT